METDLQPQPVNRVEPVRPRGVKTRVDFPKQDVPLCLVMNGQCESAMLLWPLFEQIA